MAAGPHSNPLQRYRPLRMTSLNGDLGEEATNRGSFGASVLALDRSVPNSTGVARVIGEERGQCAFLICLLMPM